MTKPTASAVTLTRPTALDEARQTLLGGLFQPLAKLGISAAFGTSAGVGGAAVDLVAQFRGEEFTEEAAWRLVWLALRDAVDDLADAARFSTTVKDSIDTAHLLQLGGAKVDLDRIEVPWTFLQRPSDLPLLRVVAGNLERALVYLGTDPHAARAAAARLPARFGDFFYERAMQQRERLDQLRDLLQSEPAVALRQSLNWLAYGAHLQSDLDAPLFAGPFSLRQLYQPLRGYWTERLEGEHGRQKERHHVVDLAEAFDAWLEPFDKTDALRVVAGGPGSGKSSFVKWWAASVMQHEPLIPTLLVPLHYLKTLDLERAVGDYAKLHGFPANPLDTDKGERRLLLILDGLDELDADQQRGRDAAAALVTAVQQLLLKNNHNFEIHVVLAGRALIVESLQGELSREHQIFHVLGYTPRGAHEGWKDPGKLLKHDHRQDWWRCWGGLSGEALAGMPAEIAGNRNLADLADQPLLNHLLAITRAADPAALNASSNVNSVYASLLRNVWERSWGEKRQIVDVRPLTVEQFNQLFESIGLAVWQKGGGRSTKLAEVAEIARLEKLDTMLPIFREGAEKGALALLAAFFFRWTGSDATFELTHKSFGEYLAARRLLRLIETLRTRLEDPDYEEADGLRLWYRRTHAAEITMEIADFLVRELRVISVDDVHSLRAALIRLFNRTLRTGMANEVFADEIPPAHFREAQRFDAAAELALFVAIGCCSSAIVETTEDWPIDERRAKVQWSPEWPDHELDKRTSAWSLLRRISTAPVPVIVLARCLWGIDLQKQKVQVNASEREYSRILNRFGKIAPPYGSTSSTVQTNFMFANLADANFFRSYLTLANLRYADLTGTSLAYVDLSEADLRHANLTNADLHNADLMEAMLQDARGLTRAQLSDARNVEKALLPGYLLGESRKQRE